MSERIVVRLSEPVGWGTSSAKAKRPVKNLRGDVEQIQRALQSIGLENLNVTGTITGPQDLTVQAIKAFQQHEFGWSDGVVDPGMNTEKRINAIFDFAVKGSPFPAPPPPPGRETLTTWGYINRELASYASLPEGDRLWAAAWALKNERNRKGPDGKPMNCDNKPLAYAEHYMLARAFVASGGWNPVRTGLWAIANVLIMTYDLGKLAYFLAAALAKSSAPGPFAYIQSKLLGMVYHLGDCPASDKPPDPISTCWGLAGAADGLQPLK